MFSSADRKKQLDARRLICRLVDRTSPNLAPLEGESRVEARSNRTLPVVLAPLEDDRVLAEEAVFALTKDLTGQGLSLVLNHPFHAPQLVIGFWRETQPVFVLGSGRQNTPLGGGFWQLGIELREVLSIDRFGLARLAAVAVQLLPESKPVA
jgi:hypothetical protein